jgi:hypothetical protein
MTSRTRQSGLTYIEVLIAAVLLAVVLVPAIEALHTGMLGAEVHATTASDHYGALSRMEEVLAEPHSLLVGVAGAAGDYTTPTSYSDPPGTALRRLVFIGLYDADNLDGDGNPFTVPDPNLDGDNDPYTGYVGLLWLRVEVEGSVTAFETLTAP